MPKSIMAADFRRVLGVEARGGVGGGMGAFVISLGAWASGIAACAIEALAT